MRRLAIAWFHPHMLAMMFRRGFEIIENGIPDGAQIRNSGFDVKSGQFFLTLERESFAEVTKGQLIPDLPPVTVRELCSVKS